MPELPVVLPERQPALRVVPMPADLNPSGDVFGGWIMAQTDIAGATVAMYRARGRVATVAVNAFHFTEPVSVGDIVSFFAEVVATGRTSITVKVEVYAQRNPTDPATVKVTEALLTYVALDLHGNKRALPELE
ncbi:acyl-CoA thioesterase [Rhodocyclus purpureus]|uniref:acyl-CoA thioesterase n=1 Tax=Rhodocyclus purpureus TaxID=1067 RepID=UPI001911DE93|nr:acyl-CoA thioesterase [Rhodocyclus purpureus]MBK5915247.1 acyl-CoA thioesterase [Rhodocyclus purpureus]